MRRRTPPALHGIAAPRLFGLAILVAAAACSPGRELRAPDETVVVDRHLSVAVVHADGTAVHWAWLEITAGSGTQVYAGHSEGGTFTPRARGRLVHAAGLRRRGRLSSTSRRRLRRP